MKAITTAMLAVVFLVPLQVCGQQENPAPSLSLHMAILQGNFEAVRQHIAAGSDLNAKDAFGSTPLIIAALFGHAEAAEALIEAGADMTIGDAYGSTPLHIAALFCRTEIVKALVNKGVDRYARNTSGSTAFDIVQSPFDDDKDIYDSVAKGLGPMGLNLDYERIKKARPEIAKILRSRPRNSKR